MEKWNVLERRRTDEPNGSEVTALDVVMLERPPAKDDEPVPGCFVVDEDDVHADALPLPTVIVERR
jgi:hypothetical protein